MTSDRLLQLVQESFDNLRRSDLLARTIEVNRDTDLLGPDTALDSIAFVTFMVDFEQRVERESGGKDEVFTIAINELHEFNPDKTKLAVGTLIDYVVGSTAKGR